MRTFTFFRSHLFIAITIATLALSACATMGPPPETMNERLAMLQISYGVLLDKAVLYKQEGRLNAQQSTDLTDLFDNIEQAITVAQTAISLKDPLNFNNQSAVVLNALTLIRAVLANTTEPPT